MPTNLVKAQDFKDQKTKGVQRLFFEYGMYSYLGDHDMWWASPSTKDSMYGKAYAVQQLEMPSIFYSFDKND